MFRPTSASLIASSDRHYAKAGRARAKVEAATAVATAKRALAEKIAAKERVTELGVEAAAAGAEFTRAANAITQARAERDRARVMLEAASEGLIMAEEVSKQCYKTSSAANVAFEEARKALPGD